jgi:hypothetical protein
MYQRGSDVKKFIVASTATISAVAITLAFAPTVSAGGNDPGVINFGTCETWSPVENRAQLAPGQTGVGPLTIIDGQVNFPQAFVGAMGCNVGS